MSVKQTAIDTIIHNKLSIDFIFNDLMVRPLDSTITLKDKYNFNWAYKLIYNGHYHLCSKTDTMTQWECIY